MDPRRDLVLKIAKGWLNTPFHHQARVRGAGVDCVQFLLAVYDDAGCMPHREVTGYAADWHLHRDEEKYLEGVIEHCDEVSDPLPGDIVLFKIGRVFSHGAIVVDWPRIIHAYVGRGVQYFDGSQGRFAGRERKFFRPRVFVDAEPE